MENRVLLGVTPLTKSIFDEEFPDLEKIDIPSYNIRYSAVLPVAIKLLADWPRISTVIKEEHAFLDKIVSERKIDVVVSDSRFGMYSGKAHSVFITHQLFLKAPFANSLAQNKNKKFINKFEEIWVPDYESESENLSGELSHGNHFHNNIRYIGPQSRLQKTSESEIKYDYLLMLSGPPPHLSNLTKSLAQKAKKQSSKRFALVSPENYETEADNIDFFCLPAKQKLSELICQSKKIVCRSGYSTLMDLHLLEKKQLLLIPTPGQPEQEYLAEYWNARFGCELMPQSSYEKITF
jgi:hypothetical protein